MALSFLNIGQTEIHSNGFVSSARTGDAEPVLWSSLGLQLHYAPENETAAKLFLEKIGDLLNAKGISDVVILPDYVDLDDSGEDLEGVFIFHFNLDLSGWQLSRQGTVEASAEFVPLNQGTIVMMNTGTDTFANGSGWFNRAHFTEDLLDSAAKYWVEEALRSFNLLGHQSISGNARYIESNLEQLPPNILALIPENSEPVAYTAQGENYVLSYLTDRNDLEDFLIQELTGQQEMQVLLPWVDAAGNRRMIELSTAEGSQAIKIHYTDVTNLPYTGSFEPHTRDENRTGKHLVTIISQFNLS